MRFLHQAVVLIVCSVVGSILYVFVLNQNSKLSKLQRRIEFLSYESSLRHGSILVPLREIIKGRPLLLNQNDSRLIRYIQTQGFLKPPSELPYNLTRPSLNPSIGQAQMVQKLLKNLTNGFFVECGALDGETRSNTLFFEKMFGWKGLLIEGDPKNYEAAVSKQRKAWLSKACLAVKPIPHEVVFQQNLNRGKIRKIKSTKLMEHFVRVQCFPFFTLISALNITTVDYFSLDVEGNELEVLRTIPFDSVYIKTLSVEFSHVDGGEIGVKTFMESKGYKVFGKLTHSNNLANDLLFVHKTLLGNSTISVNTIHIKY